MRHPEQPAPRRAAMAPRPAADGAVAPSRRGTALQRRLAAVVLLALLVTLLAVTLGRVGAQAEPEDPVAGHTVLEPGETLWDVAVASAPEDVDPREQLADLRALNDFESDRLDAWTVVLLPAR